MVGRHRLINTGIFLETAYIDLSRDPETSVRTNDGTFAQLVFWGFLSGACTDDWGRASAEPRTIMLLCFPFEPDTAEAIDRMQSGLQRMVELGLVGIYKDDFGESHLAVWQWPKYHSRKHMARPEHPGVPVDMATAEADRRKLRGLKHEYFVAFHTWSGRKDEFDQAYSHLVIHRDQRNQHNEPRT